MPHNIALVCCYGIYSQSRSKIEVSGLEEYNKSVIEDILSDMAIKTVVMCGGFTQLEAISEAQSNLDFVQNYLQKEGKTCNLKFLTENTSQKTYENLVFGYLTARKFEPDKIVVYCDNHRKNKVLVESYGLFNGLIEVEIRSFGRQDIHPNSNLQKQTEQILPQEIFSKEFDKYRELIRAITQK